MGGFEGGDEGGYWDVDTLPISTNNGNEDKSIRMQSCIEKTDTGYSIKAHAKVNIFLKITGHENGYHTLLSRFMYIEDLYDTIAFVPCECDTFTIEGCEGIPLESNTIYKAYKALNDYTGDLDILNFFYKHKVVVTKRIPSQAGLGGGSSDAAAFMRLVKEVCNLLISTKELAKLGSAIGADLPFFIYNYTSANVSGFGEIVEPFEEEPLSLELYTPDIGCDTGLVYKTFKEHLLSDISLASFIGWDKLDSKTLLERIADPMMLNDLYKAALIAYPELQNEAKEGWFFSGSGSTFFRLR
ncbi:4-(cytidine 5'-diphospho)-2-C-methyl-D-erythritol kinase [Sulfurovum sp. XGS-02]|uniref:4-(cytidine 5'-diphospho)-2-C-methyl-D-erythritol kinase n=1 Tax=Sulfurovum sp. XGS-02 TaxID=2925411 RepID=UPI0020633396|nr:4-(cytidine 5'-diphospho)-2-C-methyl-D-erythritol kinase [Sulfurovum sp. XGS-02]UPT77840.1 4-(cytidine 5'-diphospho)-2-C-methyl-D-erythritol kinase [Sulfurovum sp. XGS-02]